MLAGAVWQANTPRTILVGVTGVNTKGFIAILDVSSNFRVCPFGF